MPERTRAQIAADTGFGADHLGEVEDFVRAGRNQFGCAAPFGVDRDRPLRADAVAPVIFVGETASGPEDDRDMQILQRGQKNCDRVVKRVIVSSPWLFCVFALKAFAGQFVQGAFRLVLPASRLNLHLRGLKSGL